MQTWLEIQPNGDLIDWGRHGNGNGPVMLYTGEAAEVMRLVLEKTKKTTNQSKGSGHER